MNISDRIANILENNPEGLKASEIAKKIGCSRKDVNSYLYAHKDKYEQHEGFIWTVKLAKKKNTSSSGLHQSKSIAISSVSVKQSMGDRLVSTLTITPNANGYLISSTNNMIVCCDCNKFVSIHAMACPFCGCPVHYIANTYYHRFKEENTEVARQRSNAEQKAQEQKQQEDERKRRHEVAWNCYMMRNNIYMPWKFYEKLCSLTNDLATFNRAIERIKQLSKNKDDYWQVPNNEWYDIIVSDEATYRKHLRKWERIRELEQTQRKLKNEIYEARKKIYALSAEHICKKNGVSADITEYFSHGWHAPDEVQARIDASRYFERTYPQLYVSADSFVLLSVEEMKEEIASRLKIYNG